jgi:flagellar biosynthesis protein FliP
LPKKISFQRMKTSLKLLFATLLFLSFGIANASSPPPEIAISWFMALEKSCSAADPVHVAQYKKGLQDIMDEDLKLSSKVTNDEKFRALLELMEHEVGKLNRDQFLRECASLLVRSVNLQRKLTHFAA